MNELLIGPFTKLRKATISFVTSVRLSAWNNLAPTGQIFVKFEIWVFFENLSRKFKFDWNLTRITGIYMQFNTHFLISRWIILRMMNVSDKRRTENQNTHFMFNNFFFSRKTRRLWDNVEILRLPWLRFSRAFSSVVRQMPVYTSQKRGTVRTLPN